MSLLFSKTRFFSPENDLKQNAFRYSLQIEWQLLLQHPAIETFLNHYLKHCHFLRGAIEASRCRREWELKADLWLSPSHRPQEKTVKTDGERDVRINKWFTLFEDVRQLRLSCVPCWGSHSCGQYISCHIWSEESLLHELGFLSLQQFHNQLCLRVFVSISFTVSAGLDVLFWWHILCCVSAALPKDHLSVKLSF